MNFNALDLNLIRVLDALAQERSVTRAGDRIGLSQPAVSSALNRQVTLALPHFQAVALSVASGPYVAAVPVQFANAVRNDLNLHIFQPPLSIPVPDVRLYWHGRQNQDPAHRWMRSEIAAAVEHLAWAAGCLPPSQD